MDSATVPKIVWLFFKNIDDWDRFYKFPSKIWNLFKRRELEDSISDCGRVVNNGWVSDLLQYSPAKTGHFWIIPFECEGYGEDAYQALRRRLGTLCEKYPFLGVTYRDQHPPVSREDAKKAIRYLAEKNNMTEAEFREWMNMTSDGIIREMNKTDKVKSD